MGHRYRLTEKEFQVLSIVERDGDALLFDLEVQELASRGFIDDLAGTLVLTERGRGALRAADSEGSVEEMAYHSRPAPREAGQQSM